MSKLQEVFNRIQENKKKQKEIKKMYKEGLDQAPGYQDVLEELKTLKAKKKDIEENIKVTYSSELTQLDDLKIDLESDLVTLSDMAFNKLVKGEAVKIVDEYENEYMPEFKVRFKKLG